MVEYYIKKYKQINLKKHIQDIFFKKNNNLKLDPQNTEAKEPVKI